MSISETGSCTSAGKKSPNTSFRTETQLRTMPSYSTDPAEVQAEIRALPITSEPLPAPQEAELSPEDQALSLELFYESREGTPHAIRALKGLIAKYPEVPSLKNHLTVAYIAAGRERQADKVNDKLRRENPDYLFGHLNHASKFLGRRGGAQRIPEILGETLRLRDLKPDIELFHHSEVKGFYTIVAHFHVQEDRPGLARAIYDVLAEIIGADDPQLADGGSIVGISHAPLIFLDTTGATLWESGGGATSIGYHTAEGRRFAVPTDINNSGWIVGWAIGGGLSTAQAALVRGTEVTILHDPALQGAFWQATAINDSGLIVGQTERPFLWDDDERYDLDSLIVGLAFTDGTPLQPILGVLDINNNGDILCSSAFYRILLRKIDPPPPGLVVNSNGDSDDIDSLDDRCYTGNQTPQGQDECTLRAAIQHANRTPGLDTIVFDIPGGGIPTIAPESPLPAITDEVIIDASTQPGTAMVILEGTDADSLGAGTDALVLRGGGSTLRGLIINNFSGNGITLRDGDRNVVESCIIGTDELGTERFGNFGHGIFIRNSSHNRIGGSPETENTIMNNFRSGVFVLGGLGNMITSNYIAFNVGLGIDLAPEGVTLNDSADADGGPNNLQNFPVIDSLDVSGFVYTVYGHVSAPSPPNDMVLEFFLADSCDATGYGESGKLIESLPVTVTSNQPEPFNFSTIDTLILSRFLTATATDKDSNTSEFSHCWPQKVLRIVDVNNNPIPNMTFALSTVRDDVPLFTEDFIDSITTDATGRYDLEGDLYQGVRATTPNIRSFRAEGGSTGHFVLRLDPVAGDQSHVSNDERSAFCPSLADPHGNPSRGILRSHLPGRSTGLWRPGSGGAGRRSAMRCMTARYGCLRNILGPAYRITSRILSRGCGR